MTASITDQYASLYASFQWLVPSQFNIAYMCLHRWAENPGEARRTALCVDNGAQPPTNWTYQQLSDMTKQLSNGLLRMGVQPGERVVIGICPAARPVQFIVALLAVLGVQAISVPLSSRLPPAQQRQCIREAQSNTALVDATFGPTLLQMTSTGLTRIVGLGFEHEYIIPWHTLLARQSTHFIAPATRADAPALLCYATANVRPHAAHTLTGQLFAHSALIGALPGVVCAQNWFIQPATAQRQVRFWSSLDWSSAPGLLAGLLPSLYLGQSVFAATSTIGSAGVLEALIRHRVTHLLLDADTLRTLQAVQGMDNCTNNPIHNTSAELRAIAMHVEPDITLQAHALASTRLFDVQPNILFSLPQACALIGQARQQWHSPPGSIGRVYPGHLATVLDDQGLPCPSGVMGELVVNRHDIQGYPDPAWHLGTWSQWGDGQSHSASSPPLRLRTGLSARMNQQGDIWLAQADDGDSHHTV